MTFKTVTVLTCAPGAPAVDFCPAGTGVTTQSILVPTTDPSLISPEDIDVGVIAFSFVIATYVVATGIGFLFRIFRES